MRGLDIAGGIGLGITRGIEDLERIEKDKFEKTQRAETLRRQAVDRQLEADVAAVRPRGISRQAVASDAGPDFKDVARSEGDVARDLSEVYRKHGKTAESLKLSGEARNIDEADRRGDERKRRDAVIAKYRPQFEALRSEKPEDAMKVFDMALNRFNSTNVPDGNTAYQAMTPDGLKITVINDKTRKVVKEHVITPGNARESAAAALQMTMLHELGTVSSEDFLKAFDKGLDIRRFGLEERKTTAAENTSAAQVRKTDAETANLPMEAKYKEALIKQAEAHAEYYKKQGEKISRATGDNTPFKLATVKNGKESTPVLFRMVPGPDGKTPDIQAFTVTGERITDRKTLDALFKQPVDDDPLAAILLENAAKSGDPAQLAVAEKMVNERRATRELSKAQQDFAALPDDQKAEEYAALKKKLGPEKTRLVVGDYKPPKGTKPTAETPADAGPMGVFRRYTPQTKESAMSSMTHR